MAEIISMPQLSDTMEEGTVIKWNKKVGDNVLEGEIIAEIETDKAVQDFEIDVSGVLLFIGVQEGEKTKVNNILAIIGKKGENINHLINKNKICDQKKSVNDRQFISPVAKKMDNQINIPIDNLKGTGDHGRRKFISPVAKKMANQMNIPIDNLKGTGDHGRIVKKDIDLQIKNNQSFDKKIYHSSIRKKIAERLSYSKFSYPHYYLFLEIEVDQLIQLRKNINSKFTSQERISFNDMIIKASALSLKDNPRMNVSWNQEYISVHENINIGFAVAIEEELIVPVIKNVDQKSLLQISLEIKDKISRLKSKKIQLDELEKSTFTVSNLGMYGVESFTSIINPPNSSILSIGAIMQRPIIKNSKIEIGNVMKITLSSDHRLIDGALGSNYIRSIKKYLENPMMILL